MDHIIFGRIELLAEDNAITHNLARLLIAVNVHVFLDEANC